MYTAAFAFRTLVQSSLRYDKKALLRPSDYGCLGELQITRLALAN